MEYHTFIEAIKCAVSAKLDSHFTICTQSRLQNNGSAIDTLIIKDPARNISPSIYLNPYFARYQEGMPFDEICDDIIRTYRATAPSHDFEVRQFTDFQRARQHICMRLIHHKMNEHTLSHCPFIPFLDLAIIFVYVLPADEDRCSTILIQNTHMEMWGITADQLFEIARCQTPGHFPVEITPMDQIIHSPAPPDSDFPKMLVVSNKLKLYGAISILYTGVLSSIAEQFNSNLLIIPSSVHECIVMSDLDTDLAALDSMICEINDVELLDTEVLSNHAYHYNRETNTISSDHLYTQSLF